MTIRSNSFAVSHQKCECAYTNRRRPIWTAVTKSAAAKHACKGYLAHEIAGVTDHVGPDVSALCEAAVGGIQAERQQQRQSKVSQVEGVQSF